MDALSRQAAPGLEKWAFEFNNWLTRGRAESSWDVSGDALSWTDEDRLEWKLRFPIYLVLDHLTAETGFLEMVGRVRSSTNAHATAWAEAACFSPRSGDKGARRALMTRLLLTAASGCSGEEERALQALLPGAWTVPRAQPSRRSAYQLQSRYLARTWTAARVLACRAAQRCVECDLTDDVPSPAHRGDYCKVHLADVDHERFSAEERLRRDALRRNKVRHRKATEQLFAALAAALAGHLGPATPRTAGG